MNDESWVFGPDKIFFEDDNLNIVSPVDMDDWVITKYRRLVIGFRDCDYYLVSKEKGEDRLYYYLLKPWSDNKGDIPGRKISYDQEYVLEREKYRRLSRIYGGIAIALIPLIPVLGFLWSRTKLRLNDRFGFHPLSVTNLSIIIEVLLGLGSLAFFLIMSLGMSIGGRQVLSIKAMISLPIIAFVFILDAMMRYGRALRGMMEQYGFYEWLFGPLLNKVIKAIFR